MATQTLASLNGLTSIIVVNLNGGSRVRRCIESIRAKTDTPYELIVIDNGSTDGSLAYLESLGNRTLIRNARNIGAPAARNQGLTVASGEFIVFLDNDTIVTQGWLRRFHACAGTNPRAGIIGPMSNCVSGPQLVSGAEYRLDDSLDRYANQWAAAHAGQILPIRRLILFCMFIRRQVVDKIGGIDPSFGRWGWEDDDYSVRAQRAGFELTVARDIFIHHEGSYTAKSSNIDYRQLHADNWQVFRRKWNIDWVPGRASQAQLDAFFNQAFVPERDYVPLPSRLDVAVLIHRDGHPPNALQPGAAAAASGLASTNDMPSAMEHMRMGLSLMNACDWQNARYHFQCAGRDPTLAAEAHYGCAVCGYRLGDYHRSAVCCQRALSWIPDFLGVTPKYRSYLLDRAHTHPFKARFAADIYILLAGSYLHLQQAGDARLALRAARQLDNSREESARELEKRILDLDRGLPPEPPARPRPGLLAADNAPYDLSKKLTMLLLTHYSEKIKQNKQLAPPGVGLIQETYHSLSRVFGPAMTNLHKIVCLDRGKKTSHDHQLYESNLEIFARKYGCELLGVHGAGLQKLLIEALKHVSTPYLLFVEHDWRFEPPPIDIHGLIRAFDDHSQIHQVRFNQRRNVIARFDYLLERETTVTGIPLMRTVAHSNNPSIIRTSTLRDNWLPLCMQDPIYSVMDLSGTAFGIEEPLFKRHIQDIRRMGFSRAHEMWGTYIYGSAGDPEKIVHLGV